MWCDVMWGYYLTLSIFAETANFMMIGVRDVARVLGVVKRNPGRRSDQPADDIGHCLSPHRPRQICLQHRGRELGESIQQSGAARHNHENNWRCGPCCQCIDILNERMEARKKERKKDEGI